MKEGRVVKSAGKSLDRDSIVATALQVIDRDGAQGLTMRALGQELDVAPMALYHYVHGREDLLEAVCRRAARRRTPRPRRRPGQELLAGLPADPCELRTPHRGRPRSRVPPRRHPPPSRTLAPAAASQPRAGPTLPPHVEPTRLHRRADRQHLRAFSSFLLGQLLLEAASRGAETSPVEVAFDEGDAQIAHDDGQIDLSEMPDVARLRPLLSEDHSTAEFETALETLLDRLELDLSQ